MSTKVSIKIEVERVLCMLAFVFPIPAAMRDESRRCFRCRANEARSPSRPQLTVTNLVFVIHVLLITLSFRFHLLSVAPVSIFMALCRMKSRPPALDVVIFCLLLLLLLLLFVGVCH